MDTLLNDIISHFKKEKTALESLLKGYMEEYEFDMAKSCQQGIYLLEKKLDVLCMIQNPNFHEIKMLERQKEFLEIYGSSLFNSHQRNIPDQLSDINLKLKKFLNTNANETKEGFDFDEAIQSLLSQASERIRFVLNRKHNIFIQFDAVGKQRIVVSFTPFVHLHQDSRFSRSDYDALRNYGFSIKNDCAHLLSILKTDDDIAILKEKVAALIYECLYPNFLGKISYLEYY